MICANYRLRAVTLVAVGGLVLAAVAPVCAWADADDDGAPSRLIAMADFNRDGIADVAVAADSGALTVSLGQANGAFRSMAGSRGSFRLRFCLTICAGAVTGSSPRDRCMMNRPAEARGWL